MDRSAHLRAGRRHDGDGDQHEGPWRFRNNNTSLDVNSDRGVVTVTYAGKILKNVPITLTYWSSTAASTSTSS